MLIFQSLKSFFKKNLILSIVFILLLIVSITGTFLGVNYVFCRVNGYNMYLYEKKTFILNCSGKEIPNISKILDKYSDNIVSIYGNTTMSLDDDNQIDVITYGYFSENVADELEVIYGEGFKNSDLLSLERKLIISKSIESSNSIGNYINLSGNQYKIIGVANQNIIPIGSIDQIDSLSIMMLNIPTEEFIQEFKTFLEINYSGYRLTIPDTSNIKTFIDFSPFLLPTIILLILCFLNLSFIYVYFLKIRNKNYQIYSICGASNFKIVSISLIEVSILLTLSSVISLAIYKILSLVIFTDKINGYGDYITIKESLIIYLFILLLFLLIFIPKIIACVFQILNKNKRLEINNVQ